MADKEGKRDWEPISNIIAAVIGGLFVLAAAYVGLRGNGNEKTPQIVIHLPDTPTPILTLVAPTSTPTDTLIPTANYPSPTNTSVPSAIPGPTILATTPVAHNADWQPFAQEFDGVAMVLVPVGCFEMGSTDGAGDEQPVHEVCFNEPFWIDKYEVTNTQYGSTGCTDHFSDPNQPSNCVSWNDARDYCVARGAHLPTEAEWEYTARGPDDLVYPWGNTFVAENGVHYSNSGGQIATVGSKLGGASWVGALDLSGNVWEWVVDWYDAGYYETLQGGVINPTGPSSGQSRVLRGGSFSDSPRGLRAALRYWHFPSLEFYGIGFRCARSQ